MLIINVKYRQKSSKKGLSLYRSLIHRLQRIHSEKKHFDLEGLIGHNFLLKWQSINVTIIREFQLCDREEDRRSEHNYYPCIFHTLSDKQMVTV